MIVFKTFIKVLKKYKFTVLLYTMILIVFGSFQITTNQPTTSFVNTKPNVFIVNHDENKGVTKNFITYIEKNCNLVQLKNEKDAVNDALFYRDVHYVIYIPKHYRNDVINGKQPEFKVQSTNDYSSVLAEMIISRYIKAQSVYAQTFSDEKEIIQHTNASLKSKTKVEITSKLDTQENEKIASFFNFASYSIMATIIFVICSILSSFHEKNIQKRTVISSMKHEKYQFQILLSSCSYAILIFIIYTVLGIILIGNPIFTIKGWIYLINLFLFTFCSLTIALLMSTLVHHKEALNGIVNVLALGSSFLCGAFVPAQFLPSFVLTIAHVLPTYWYIHSNDLLATVETINGNTIQPILINFFILILFCMMFIVLNMIIGKKKQKIK